MHVETGNRHVGLRIFCCFRLDGGWLAGRPAGRPLLLLLLQLLLLLASTLALAVDVASSFLFH